MEETITLRELFQTIKKHLWSITLITVIATATSGIVSYFFLTPIYQSSTQILVNQTKSDQQAYNYNEVQTNLQLVNTYNVIIKSPAILELVVRELDLDLTTEELNKQISVAAEKNSQVISISVQDSNPAQAAAIANTTASVFKSEIVKIMSVDNVSVLSEAVVKETPTPIKPRPALNMAIALVVGLMAGVGLAFLLEFLDNTIKTEQDIEKLLELPVLGAIAVIDHEKEEQASTAKRQSRVRGENVGA
ncbi:capsular biosynthesis protein [Bacillus luteolus]|uniref:Capsular biosynthesis protein n=1 Tax=Litchfieldia luteola TaxID=682179 RepID=A0ABR9QFD9_9BACI|nr:Wzz/FepE/Etk N-terminal domain-containing protein [Cytobacillus luteolus]MBE4907204.1 capsular biosynthesis protein [Cytobacillus luteolus]MBP1943322.1 capsular polysaccharide biosynthesis protein [Cytobacillus luteolus]